MSVMNSIDKFKAARQMQQALRKDPNNVEALLQLATRLGTLKEPDLAQKRKVLNRILFLERTHPRARTMLFEMDRAEIGGDPSRLSMAVILTHPSLRDIEETPLILRYSPIHQFLVYLLIVFTVVIGVSNLGKPEGLAVFGAFLVFLVIPLWSVSAMVEISDTGINVSRLFGVARWKIAWHDIKAFKPRDMGKGLKMITRTGKVVRISSQITGYFAMIEILRQMRPDLFDLMEVTRAGDAAQDVSVITSGEAKTFTQGQQAYN